ncbi:glycoprotein Xg isoform X12 [Prionailurus bengalensis]|uniref:glycoprotein Xg isoform X12 n=1 Tax=Prionailurus bengalensis TaxID=37029 RepID=UPI001CA92B81|nr:glycoprotein Xg isoform X12 [Prionailurus bengalensis]
MWSPPGTCPPGLAASFPSSLSLQTRTASLRRLRESPVNVTLIWPMPSMTPNPPRSQAQISTPDRSPHITHSQACPTTAEASTPDRSPRITHSQACPTTAEISTPDRSPRITHSQACPTTAEASTPGQGHPRTPSPAVPTAVELAVVATIPTMTATETLMEEGVLDPTLTEIIMAETDTPRTATSKVTQ